MTQSIYDYYNPNPKSPGEGWDFVANPFLLPNYQDWRSQKEGANTTYQQGYYDKSGMWRQGSAPGFSGGAGAGQGGGSAAGGSGGGASGAGSANPGYGFGSGGAGASGSGAATGGSAMGSGIDWQKWGQAALGAYSSYADAQAKKASTKNAGKVDLYTQEDPWGPSIDYRNQGMDYIAKLLAGAGAGAPAGAGGGGGGGGRNRQEDWWNSFRGATGNTDRLLSDLTGRAEGGHELYAPANAFTKGLLSGQDPNAYRSETFGALRDFSSPDLERFTQMLFAGQMPGTAGGTGGRGGGGGGYSASYGGGGAPTSGPVGVEKYIKDILDEKYLKDNPHLQDVIDASTRDIQRKFMEEDVPGVTTQFAGAGRLGSGAWANALSKAERERSTALSDTVGGIRAQDYNARMADIMSALQQGTDYDLGYMKIQGDANAAGAAAGASRYATDRESADRMSLARLSALQDAIGGGIDLGKFRLSGMSSLSDLYGRDQMGALSMVPELSGLDLRDLGTAAELSIGSDKNRGDYGLGMAQIADARRGRNAGLSWQREQYNREEPWKRAMQYADIINALGGQGGTRHEYGTDQRNVSPYGGSAIGQGIAGGLAGWYAAQDQKSKGA